MSGYLHADASPLLWRCGRCKQHVVVGQTVTIASLIRFVLDHERRCGR